MLTNKCPHSCWDTAWGHTRTFVMLMKSDPSLVGNLVPYTESPHRSLESQSPQGNAGWEGHILTHSQGRPSCGHSPVYDCLIGGDWLFLLCHHILLEFSHCFYIKACIWMKGNRRRNPKEPMLPWQAKGFEVKPLRKLYHSSVLWYLPWGHYFRPCISFN